MPSSLPPSDDLHLCLIFFCPCIVPAALRLIPWCSPLDKMPLTIFRYIYPTWMNPICTILSATRRTFTAEIFAHPKSFLLLQRKGSDLPMSKNKLTILSDFLHNNSHAAPILHLLTCIVSAECVQQESTDHVLYPKGGTPPTPLSRPFAK